MLPELRYVNMVLHEVFETIVEDFEMSISAERKRIIEEIEQIPENKLEEVYTLVHNYRIENLQLEPDPFKSSKSVMDYAGAWKDLPDGMLEDFLNEVRTRREEAFSTRRTR